MNLKQRLAACWERGLTVAHAGRRTGATHDLVRQHYRQFYRDELPRGGRPILMRDLREHKPPAYDGPDWIGFPAGPIPLPRGPEWIGRVINR